MSNWQIARLTAIVIFVGGLSIVGLSGAFHDWSQAATRGQRVQSAAEIVYGILGFVVVGGLLWKKDWTLDATSVWGVSLIIAAGFAPVVWGDAAILSGVIAAAMATVIVMLVHRGVRIHLRRSPVKPGV